MHKMSPLKDNPLLSALEDRRPEKLLHNPKNPRDLRTKMTVRTVGGEDTRGDDDYTSVYFCERQCRFPYIEHGGWRDARGEKPIQASSSHAAGVCAATSQAKAFRLIRRREKETGAKLA